MSDINLDELYPKPWSLRKHTSGKKQQWVVKDADGNFVCTPAGETEEEVKAIGQEIVDAANRTNRKQKTLVPAKDIPERGFFRKRTGTYVYLRINEDSIKYHQSRSKPDGLVYGVAHNGNITAVGKETIVAVATFADFESNYQHDVNFDRELTQGFNPMNLEILDIEPGGEDAD